MELIQNHSPDGKEKFYSDAQQYWSEIPATVDGMLGGFGSISKTDVDDSKRLLKQLFSSKEPPARTYALDCGAGIGRITKHLLVNFFDKVDMVEQNPEFLQQAKEYLGNTLAAKIGRVFPMGLQIFRPENNKYDVIWVQWVSGHLIDPDYIEFLQSCRLGLRENGVVVVKENISSSDEVDKDEKDSSVTRPYSLFKELFAAAGFHCYRQVKQKHFPKGLYTVYMFVLKPSKQA